MKNGTTTGVTPVASEKFLVETGTRAERVACKGTVDAARETVSEQIDCLFADATFSIAQARQGRMKVLAITSKGAPADRARRADHGGGGHPLCVHAEMGGLHAIGPPRRA